MDPRRARRLGQPKAHHLDAEELELLGDRAPVNSDARIRRAISEKLQQDKFPIPPLPMVVIKLQRIINSRDPDLRMACAVIERDPTLGGRVLVVASSATFGLEATTDLGRAVVRLGINGLRDITYALTLGRVFRGHGRFDEWMRREVERAFPRARATQAVYHVLNLPHHSGFLNGLLVDVGRMALIALIAEQKEALGRDEASLRALVDELHADVGSLVLSRWDLSRELVDLARVHHQPAEDAGPLAQQVRALAAAQVLCEHIEAVTDGRDTGEALDALFAAPALRAVGLDDERLPQLVDLVQQAYADNTLLA
jgi:HD-like signal output (HDOD) protein